MIAIHFRNIATCIMAAIATVHVSAQEQKNAAENVDNTVTVNASDILTEESSQSKTSGFADRLDVAVSAGTTGIGVDLSMPINETFRVRAGFSFMPSWKHTMHFKLSVGDASEKRQYDENGNRIPTRFDRLAKVFNDMTGYKVSKYVDMYGRPTYHNASLLVDVFPFHNKKWFLTGGVYYGNKNVAKAYNKNESTPMLFCVGMYNHMIERGSSDNREDYILQVPDGSGRTMDIDLRDLAEDSEKMGIHLGDYFLVPDEEAMVKATVQADRWKPYLGFGYGDYEPKADKKYGVMLECGFMWWGWTPRIDCYGTDLVTQHVKGAVGRYVNAVKTMKVFPVINVRVSRRLFK